MIISQTERTLLDVSTKIGSIAESNCRYTYLLATRLEKAGKPLGDFGIGEFLALLDEFTKEFNLAPIGAGEEMRHG